MFLQSLLLCCFASFSAFLHANEYTLRLDKINSEMDKERKENSRLLVEIMKENGQRLAHKKSLDGVYRALVVVDIHAKQDGSCTIAHKLLTKTAEKIEKTKENKKTKEIEKTIKIRLVNDEWTVQGGDLEFRKKKGQRINIRRIDIMEETDFWKAVSKNEGHDLAQIKQNFWLQHFKQNDRYYYVHQVWASSPETKVHNYCIAIDIWPETSMRSSLQGW